MATFSAEKSGLSRGSSDQHFVIILMISSSSAHSSSTIGLKGLLPDWLGRRTDSTISTEEVNMGLLDWKHIFSSTMTKKKTLRIASFWRSFLVLLRAKRAIAREASQRLPYATQMRVTKSRLFPYCQSVNIVFDGFGKIIQCIEKRDKGTKSPDIFLHRCMNPDHSKKLPCYY